MKRAEDFRQRFGLRADRVWVLTVAAMPQAQGGVAAFGLPLTPEEVSELQHRAATTEQVVSVVNAYGARHPHDWAGSFIESSTGTVVASFAGDVDVHRKALELATSPTARLMVIQVEWSLQELNPIFDEVVSSFANDRTWYLDNGMYPLGADLHESRNRIEVEVSSTNAHAQDLISERFRADGKLVVLSDGTGLKLLPTGQLTGTVVDPTGSPVPDLEIRLIGDIPGAAPESDAGLLGTDINGRFKLTLPATGYDVQVWYYEDPDGSPRLVGSKRVVIRAAKTETVQFTVTTAE